MIDRGAVRISAFLAGALVLAAAGAADPRAQEPTESPSAPPRPSGPGHHDVRSVRLLIPDGGRVAWSPQGDRIAYDKAGEDGLYDIYVADAEGHGEQCVTCNVYELRNTHAFNPDWAPGGDWLVFQVQDIAKRLKMGALELSSPLRSAHSELWVAPPEGRRAWQITQQGERGGGSPADPHFAYDGARILWSERVAAQPKPWGDWVVRVAELTFKRGTPMLGRVKTYEPSRGLVIAHGFTPDDQGFFYGAGAFDAGQELHRLRFKGKTSEPMPPDGGVSGEAAQPTPGKDALAVASSLGLPRPDDWHRLPRRRDVWLAGDGVRERLTFFNHPSSDHSLGEALIDDLAWSPAGDRFLVHVVSTGGGQGRGGPLTVQEGIWLVVMDPSYRR